MSERLRAKSLLKVNARVGPGSDGDEDGGTKAPREARISLGDDVSVYRRPATYSIDHDVEKFRAWEFDILSHPEGELLDMLRLMFEDFQALDLLDISAAELGAVFQDVRTGYAEGLKDINKRYYHTFVHGVDVAQTVYCFLTRFRGWVYLDQTEIICLLFSSLCHDMGHTGVTNRFYVVSKHELAIKYDNVAVLENLHAELTQELINKHDLLHALNDDDKRKFESLMKSSILCTDMMQHKELEDKAEALGKSGRMRPGQPLAREDLDTYCGFLLHCGDLSNPAKPFKVAEKWASLITKEFFGQGTLERMRGLGVSKNMDPNDTHICELQAAFLSFIIIPTYTALQVVLPATNPCVETSLNNRVQWGKKKEVVMTLEQQATLRTLAIPQRRASLGEEQIKDEELEEEKEHFPLTNKVLDSYLWVGFMTLVTVYALYGDDVRLASTGPSADDVFYAISTTAFALFMGEIIVASVAQLDYWNSFYFWLDVISTISLLADIAWIYDPIMEGFGAGGDDGAAIGSAKSARASRTVRIIRLIRLVRIVKLYKTVQKSKELRELQELAEEAENSLALPFPNMASSKHHFDRYNNSETDCMTRDDVKGMMSEVYNGQDVPPGSVDSFMRRVNQFRHVAAAKRKDKDEELDNNVVPYQAFALAVKRAQAGKTHNVHNLEQHKALKQSQVGRELADLTTRRVILLVLALLFVLPFFDATTDETDESQQYGLDALHRYHQQPSAFPKYEDEIIFYMNDVEPLHLNLFGETTEYITGLSTSTVSDYYEAGEDAILEDFRSTEILAVESTGCVGVNENATTACKSEAYFSKRGLTRYESELNIGKTTFVIVMLMVGAVVFTNDANRLVIGPIERMVKLVQVLAKDPLTKPEVVAKQVDEFTINQGANNNTNSYEIKLLEDTLKKITSLVQIGFGDAGAEIIGGNMTEGDFDPMVPGRKMHGCFGFCDIRRFTDATECLKEEVMIFTNTIALIVHDAVHHNKGAANKNIGDAFLVVWKLDAKTQASVIADIEAHEAPEHLQPATAVDFFPAAMASGMDLSTRKWTPSIADHALISFMRTACDISNSEDLTKYRENALLLTRFEYPFRVRMGFGLHIGWAIEGAIGSVYKIDASYLSPDVNMSARLEAATKQFRTPILMSHWFYNALTPHVRQFSRCIDCVTVKGSVQPMCLYTCDILHDHVEAFSNLDHFQAAQTDMPVGFMALFKTAVDAYFAGDWPTAHASLVKGLQMKEEDGPSITLLEVMEKSNFIAPSEWPGYRELTEK